MPFVLTRRGLWLFALGLVPAVLSALFPPLEQVALAVDLAVLALVVIDGARAPRPGSVSAARQVEPVLSASVPAPVTLVLERRASASAPAWRGEVREVAPAHAQVTGAHQRIELGPTPVSLRWSVTPTLRGDLTLGDAFVRLEGPWGLCARQFACPGRTTVKVYPDLRVLHGDALALARAQDDAAKRTTRVRAEGREFESLREYREGDDRRSIDWKATARRGKPMVRAHQPERNQHVLLVLDCGRHMAGEVGGRRKLDHAVDAALRLARVSLAQGDQLGLVAFGATVRQALPPRKGPEQLRAIVQALYRVEATLDESDYGAALDRAFARGSRRALVVIITDLLDPDSGAALIRRTRRLVPRHLPLVASLLDDDVHTLALARPTTGPEAYERSVASRVEAEAAATVAKLREAGARVVRQSPATFGAASVSAYLEIKSRGLL